MSKQPAWSIAYMRENFPIFRAALLSLNCWAGKRLLIWHTTGPRRTPMLGHGILMVVSSGPRLKQPCSA